MYGILNLSDKKFSTEQEANEVLTFGDSLRNALNSLRPYDKESELVDLKQSYKKLDRLYTNAQPKMKEASAYLQSKEQEAQKAQEELERKTIEAQKDVNFYFIPAGRDKLIESLTIEINPKEELFTNVTLKSEKETIETLEKSMFGTIYEFILKDKQNNEATYTFNGKNYTAVGDVKTGSGWVITHRDSKTKNSWFVVKPGDQRLGNDFGTKDGELSDENLKKPLAERARMALQIRNLVYVDRYNFTDRNFNDAWYLRQ